ncbi:MAG TPA: pilus (MSHA type) biogenesis protein MshL [Myxococcota bacterium]|nr:pilus (MSHA type) biogenesis protein MshL [Myxococcota bacterium]
MKIVHVAAIACASLALSGCAVVKWLTPPASREPEPGVVEIALEEAVQNAKLPPPVPPAEVRDALVPPLGGGEGAEPARFDVAVKEMPTREFLLSLVADSSQNLTMDAGLTGSVTLSLKSVTIADVLAALADVYGYSWERRPYGYHVGAAGMQTRIFQVDYLDLKRVGQSQTRVSSGEVNSGSSSANNSGNSNGNQIVTSPQAQQSIASSIIKTDSVADFWADLQASLSVIIGPGEGRSVVISPTAGVVVVRAFPGELREVGDFLQQAQGNLARQVILEAKIIEVTLDDGFQAGINWALITKHAIIAQTGGGSLLADGVSEISGNTGNLDPSLGPLPSGTDTSAFGGAFSSALHFGDFSAFIELLETQGRVHILSSPRVSAMNNQKAVIKVGTDEFFVTDVSTTTVASTSPIVTPDITLTPFFSGIALDVTPQISERGDIVLHIHPSISLVEDQTKTIIVGDTTQTLPLARSTIRESDSVVRARSGQVIVLGGLMQDRQNVARAGTPWLDRIPYLGFLFRHQRDVSDKTELVILVRAVVATPDTERDDLQRSADRIQAMRRGTLWEPAPPVAPPVLPPPLPSTVEPSTAPAEP